MADDNASHPSRDWALLGRKLTRAGLGTNGVGSGFLLVISEPPERAVSVSLKSATCVVVKERQYVGIVVHNCIHVINAVALGVSHVASAFISGKKALTAILLSNRCFSIHVADFCAVYCYAICGEAAASTECDWRDFVRL